MDRSIEDFYREHADAVYAFLVSLSRDRNLAEDLMQDTFVKATRALGGYRGGNPRSWLFAIARSAFIDDTRRRRPIPVEHIDEPQVEDTDISEVDAIQRALDQLPQRQRTALLLCDSAGLGYAEVGEAVGCTPGAAKVLVHRARVAFRSHYSRSAE